MGHGGVTLVILQRNQLRDIIERRRDQDSVGYTAWIGVVGFGVFQFWGLAISSAVWVVGKSIQFKLDWNAAVNSFKLK